KDLRSRFRKDPDERIIGRVQNKSRDRNAAHHVGGGSTSIVISRTFKSAIVGGDFVVELAQGGDTPQTQRVECIREEPCLSPQPATQFPHEIVFVQTIAT